MFKLHSEYKPTGDRPKVIEYLSKGIILVRRKWVENTYGQ